MRISDWSSDVCSSDLEDDAVAGLGEAPAMSGAEPRACADTDDQGALLQILHDLLQYGSPTNFAQPSGERSEERRVGKECVSTCRSRWSPYHSKKKQTILTITHIHKKKQLQSNLIMLD